MVGCQGFSSRNFLNSIFGSQKSSLYSKLIKTLEHPNQKKKFSSNFYHCKGIFHFSWKYDFKSDTYF